MSFHPPDHGIGSAAGAAGAAGAGTSKVFLALTIVVIVGTVLFIGALGIALGVGFGVGLRNKISRPVKLSPPTVICDGLSTATCGCPAVPPSFSPRIINGDTAREHSWPWMVYLTMNNNQKTCTGFLISQRHVLTAASCVGIYGYNITVNLGINNYQSIAGGVNITNSTNLLAIAFGDIAVVTLGINITTFSPTIKPCCLTADQAQPTVDTHGVIAGWGETSATNQLILPGTSQALVSPTLQQAVVQVQNPSFCGISSGNDTFCASYDSISACPIDAGGPLMISYQNAWTCVGIITGRPTCSNPITFTRIAPYALLIQNITGIPLNYYSG